MGVREILWLAIALLAVYVAVQLYRVLKIGAAESAKRPAADVREADRKAGRRPAGASAGAGHSGADDDNSDVADSAPPPTPPVAAGPSGEGFQLELETQQLRRDVAQLRAELGEQRKEIADLAARLRSHEEQVATGAAAKGASPEYDEALVFARRGFDDETIAERCGITVAEAALVRALAQRDAGEPGARP